MGLMEKMGLQRRWEEPKAHSQSAPGGAQHPHLLHQRHKHEAGGLWLDLDPLLRQAAADRAVVLDGGEHLRGATGRSSRWAERASHHAASPGIKQPSWE